MPFPHLFWPYWWVINTRHVFNSLNNIYWILRVFYRNLMWNWNFPTFFLDLEYIVWKDFYVPASSFLGKFGWSLYFFLISFFISMCHQMAILPHHLQHLLTRLQVACMSLDLAVWKWYTFAQPKTKTKKSYFFQLHRRWQGIFLSIHFANVWNSMTFPGDQLY